MRRSRLSKKFGLQVAAAAFGLAVAFAPSALFAREVTTTSPAAATAQQAVDVSGWDTDC